MDLGSGGDPFDGRIRLLEAFTAEELLSILDPVVVMPLKVDEVLRTNLQPGYRELVTEGHIDLSVYRSVALTASSEELLRPASQTASYPVAKAASHMLSVTGVMTTTSTGYADTPDAASLDITGDLDIRMVVSLTDWTPATTKALVSKWAGAGDQRSYLFEAQGASTGKLQFNWDTTGAGGTGAASTAAPTITDGGILGVRVVMDVDNGASGNDVKFYTKSAVSRLGAMADAQDDSGWTQLGSTVTTAGVTSIFAGTALLEIGAAQGSEFLNGQTYAVVVKNGINGTTVANPDFTGLAAGTTSLTDSTGKTYTLRGDATVTVG